MLLSIGLNVFVYSQQPSHPRIPPLPRCFPPVDHLENKRQSAPSRPFAFGHSSQTPGNETPKNSKLWELCVCILSVCFRFRIAYLIMLVVTLYRLFSVSAPFANYDLGLLQVCLSVTITHSYGHLVRKTPFPECNLHGMTTWVPTHAPNLWAIRPGECPSYSCAMHADHPWIVTLTSRLFPSDSLIVAHPTALSTPHAWTLHDLDFSLTESWNVTWRPPFSAQLYCLGDRGPRPPRPSPGCRPLLGYPYSRASWDTGPSSQPPIIRGPTITVVHAEVRGLVGTVYTSRVSLRHAILTY